MHIHAWTPQPCMYRLSLSLTLFLSLALCLSLCAFILCRTLLCAAYQISHLSISLLLSYSLSLSLSLSFSLSLSLSSSCVASCLHGCFCFVSTTAAAHEPVEGVAVMLPLLFPTGFGHYYEIEITTFMCRTHVHAHEDFASMYQ